MPPESAGESSPQEEQLDPLFVQQNIAMLATRRLDSDVLNGDWLAGTEGVASDFIHRGRSSLGELKPVRHYRERLLASNSAQCAAFILRLSDPEAVKEYDRMADEYNAGLLVRAQQATTRRELEAVAWDIIGFVQRVKVLANSTR